MNGHSTIQIELTPRQLQLIIETMASGNVPISQQQEVFDLVNQLRIKLSASA